jgi:hypothetical protein
MTTMFSILSEDSIPFFSFGMVAQDPFQFHEPVTVE